MRRRVNRFRGRASEGERQPRHQKEKPKMFRSATHARSHNAFRYARRVCHGFVKGYRPSIDAPPSFVDGRRPRARF